MKLTHFSKSGGCAAKLGPRELSQALASVRTSQPPEVLVGYDRSDDAGVYRIGPDLALVQTVDYFTPIVDDPYTFGQIAAANALSDVYAMGGTPCTALSIVAFPATGLDFSILGAIMEGGLDKLREAGAALLGGHSIKDAEIKFGYAVTGTIDPKFIKDNRGARVGDRVFLTKPLGIGLITTALKNEKADPGHVAEAIATMTRLNRDAAAIAMRFNVHTMTDVTGFGLVGHASEVAVASGLSVRIDHARLPVLPGALEYGRQGFCSGGLLSNLEYYSDKVRIGEVPAEYTNLFFDPQTSGGLLIFCDPANADALASAFEGAAEIGVTAPLEGSRYVEIY